MTRRLTALAAAILLAGCGGLQTPNMPASFEGQAAVRGRQVVAATSSGLDSIDEMMANGVIQIESGRLAIEALRGIGDHAEKLANVLEIIDTTKDTLAKEAALKDAAAIIKAIQTAVAQGLVPINNSDDRGRVAGILQVIADALVQLALYLPGGQVAPGQPNPPLAMQADQPTAWGLAWAA